MKLKGLIETDFVNYKSPCMTLEFPICKGFKCDKINGKRVCQNSTLATEPDIDISASDIVWRYIHNPITEAICCQGLEPLDSISDLLQFIHIVRIYCHDPIIIYTGYEKDEISDKLELLKKFDNIVVKFGRFLLNRPPKYDEVLGVTLASDNQYAEKIS